MLVPVSRMNTPAMTIANGSPSCRLARARASIYVSSIQIQRIRGLSTWILLGAPNGVAC